MVVIGRLGVNPLPANCNHSPIYANSLDPDEVPSNSASHVDPSYLTLENIFTNFEQHKNTLKIVADNILSAG